MFKISSEENKTIIWPVKVEVAADGGKTQRFEFTGVFKLLNDDQRDALEQATDTPALATEGGDAADAAPALAGAWKDAMIDRILWTMTDWKGVVGDDDQPLPFSRDSLRAAARGTRGVSVLRAINMAIGEISQGARAKN
jgi:hypothetical protein